MILPEPLVQLREASRIALRPLCEADETLYCSLYTDPDTMAFLGPPWSHRRATRSFRSLLGATDNAPGVFTVLEKATGTPIGLCGWYPPDTGRCRVEIGILLNASGRNRRYSIEAISAVLDLAFMALPINTVWAQYHRANSAADRLFVAVGMRMGGLEVGEDAPSTQVTRSIDRSMWQRT